MNKTSPLTLRSKSWLFWFVLADIFVILVTILEVYVPNDVDILCYGTLLSLANEVTLKNEVTFGVWWAGVHLIIAALISFEIYQKRRRSIPWLFYSIIFAGLAFDEMCSIHERFLHNWYVIGAIFMVGVIPFLYSKFKLYIEGKFKTIVLVSVGVGMMASAAPMEYLEHHLTWPSSLAGLRLGVEEGLEIFGALTCLVALVRERSNSYWPDPLSHVVPRIRYNKHVLIFFALLFLVHIAISVFTACWLDVSSRGNPAVYLPSAVFLIVASGCYWNHRQANKHRNIWIYCLLICLLVSFATYYLTSTEASLGYLVLLGEIHPSSKIYLLYVLYILLPFMIAFLEIEISNVEKFTLLALAVSMLFAYIINKSMISHYILTGLWSVMLLFVVGERVSNKIFINNL